MSSTTTEQNNVHRIQNLLMDHGLTIDKLKTSTFDKLTHQIFNRSLVKLLTKYLKVYDTSIDVKDQLLSRMFLSAFVILQFPNYIHNDTEFDTSLLQKVPHILVFLPKMQQQIVTKTNITKNRQLNHLYHILRAKILTWRLLKCLGNCIFLNSGRGNKKIKQNYSPN